MPVLIAVTALALASGPCPSATLYDNIICWVDTMQNASRLVTVAGDSTVDVEVDLLQFSDTMQWNFINMSSVAVNAHSRGGRHLRVFDITTEREQLHVGSVGSIANIRGTADFTVELGRPLLSLAVVATMKLCGLDPVTVPLTGRRTAAAHLNLTGSLEKWEMAEGVTFTNVDLFVNGPQGGLEVNFAAEVYRRWLVRARANGACSAAGELLPSDDNGCYAPAVPHLAPGVMLPRPMTFEVSTKALRAHGALTVCAFPYALQLDNATLELRSAAERVHGFAAHWNMLDGCAVRNAAIDMTRESAARHASAAAVSGQVRAQLRRGWITLAATIGIPFNSAASSLRGEVDVIPLGSDIALRHFTVAALGLTRGEICSHPLEALGILAFMPPLTQKELLAPARATVTGDGIDIHGTFHSAELNDLVSISEGSVTVRARCSGELECALVRAHFDYKVSLMGVPAGVGRLEYPWGQGQLTACARDAPIAPGLTFTGKTVIHSDYRVELRGNVSVGGIEFAVKGKVTIAEWLQRLSIGGTAAPWSPNSTVRVSSSVLYIDVQRTREAAAWGAPQTFGRVKGSLEIGSYSLNYTIQLPTTTGEIALHGSLPPIAVVPDVDLNLTVTGGARAQRLNEAFKMLAVRLDGTLAAAMGFSGESVTAPVTGGLRNGELNYVARFDLWEMLPGLHLSDGSFAGSQGGAVPFINVQGTLLWPLGAHLVSSSLTVRPMRFAVHDIDMGGVLLRRVDVELPCTTGLAAVRADALAPSIRGGYSAAAVRLTGEHNKDAVSLLGTGDAGDWAALPVVNTSIDMRVARPCGAVGPKVSGTITATHSALHGLGCATVYSLPIVQPWTTGKLIWYNRTTPADDNQAARDWLAVLPTPALAPAGTITVVAAIFCFVGFHAGAVWARRAVP